MEGDHLLLSTPFAPDEGPIPLGIAAFFLRSEDTDIEFSDDAPASSVKVVLPSGQLTGKRKFKFIPLKRCHVGAPVSLEAKK